MLIPSDYRELIESAKSFLSHVRFNWDGNYTLSKYDPSEDFYLDEEYADFVNELSCYLFVTLTTEGTEDDDVLLRLSTTIGQNFWFEVQAKLYMHCAGDDKGYYFTLGIYYQEPYSNTKNYVIKFESNTLDADRGELILGHVPGSSITYDHATEEDVKPISVLDQDGNEVDKIYPIGYESLEGKLPALTTRLSLTQSIEEWAREYQKTGEFPQVVFDAISVSNLMGVHLLSRLRK